MAGKSNGASVFKRGDSWYHYIKILKDDGSTVYSKKGGFATASEAEKSYRECDEEFKKACRSYQISNRVNTEIGLKDYMTYWFEDVYSERIENTTRMVGAYTLYDLILPHMEQEIKLRLVNVEYLDLLLERTAKVSDSAGNKCRELLNLALKDAVTQGYLKNNPVPGTRTYKRRKPNVIILSKEKLKALLAAASKSNWYLEILLAVFCGLRKGEIGGLKYSDFDMEEQTVSISRQITSNPVIPKGQSRPEEYRIAEKPPKTDNSYRTLRVPETVIRQVNIRKKLTDGNKKKLGDFYLDQDYISCQENGVPHSVTAFNNTLTKLCDRNALPHVTVHGLRHPYVKHKTKDFLRIFGLIQYGTLRPYRSLSYCSSIFCSIAAMLKSSSPLFSV